MQGEAAGFQHGQEECLGVLVTNLGTPDAPSPQALRRYLGEFLWDPRVVEIPRPLWWLILHGIILRTRPRRSAAAYAKVWTDEGSPLLVISRRQAVALQRRLSERLAGPVRVALGMRYGNPSIAAAMEELRQAGARRLLVLPLYPQYSAATTASTFDALAAALGRRRWLPDLRFVSSYHRHPGYLDALTASIREAWDRRPPAEHLLFSFHGVPKRYLLAGDPYHCFCHVTARLVAERLDLPRERWQVTFQSRFGRAEWLQPYTDETLKKLGRDGVRSVDVICPGFSADCLETIEEIGEENRGYFLEAGGQALHYIEALNDRDDHMDALADLVLSHAGGWPETAAEYDAEALAAERARGRERALSMGAEA